MLAIFARISGTTRIKGTTGTTGIIGVVVVVNEGVETVLGEVGDEPGEVWVERNRTLTGVGIEMG